jgi:hypothetical protein
MATMTNIYTQSAFKFIKFFTEILPKRYKNRIFIKKSVKIITTKRQWKPDFE